MYEGSLFSPPAPSFIICRLSDDGRSDQCKVIPHCGFDLLSLIISDVVHLCMSLLPICLLWKNIYLGLLLTFFLGFLFLFLFLILSCMSCLYILEIKPMLVTSFPNIFSQSVCCLFILDMVSFAVQKLVRFIRSHLVIFAFISFALGG